MALWLTFDDQRRRVDDLEHMKDDKNSVMDDLARFIVMVGQDSVLRHRFCQLAALSSVQRSNEIHILAEQMAAQRKDPDLIRVFRLFADSRVFEAGMVALRESGYLES